MSEGPDPITATGTYLTRDVLEAAIKKVRESEFIAHGSPEDPHVVHPSGGICRCGQWFAPHGLPMRR